MSRFSSKYRQIYAICQIFPCFSVLSTPFATHTHVCPPLSGGGQVGVTRGHYKYVSRGGGEASSSWEEEVGRGRYVILILLFTPIKTLTSACSMFLS